MRNFLGKTAIITGAANGIGKAIAFELARRGSRLALVDIDQENLRSTAFGVEALGISVSQHVIDVANPHAVSKLPEAVIEWHKKADILINCAGVSVTAPLEDQSIDDIDWITGVNYLGTVYTCRYFVPLMKELPEAAIVNVSSAAGLLGFRKRTTYSASKFAVIGFSEALRAENYRSPISVTCAIPGPIKTDMISRARIYGEGQEELERNYLAKAGLSAEVTAKKILSAVASKKGKVYITKESIMISVLRRIFGNGFVAATSRFEGKLPA
ncbi:MAG: SDR family oxidoreductase [Chitinophagales bacterium]|nr:SDR family oxidoreductase [Chitinophagales bacterium]